ncbi:MAG: hypothetical protein CVT79_12250 [Alphaproteobacteria bacterium HGW-Alphaproteobacteria-18]|nr:MAG: hypothetical protein CVT79_12250 [Alphaproteobacteria bacterium HGW-Alphaproteobacteria-18]
MGSLGPSVWAVSDGRAGNAAQVRALTSALGALDRWVRIAHIAGEAHRQEPLVVTPRAPWRWLPADRWASPLQALPKEQRPALAAPWPTLWIAAGRRSAPLTRYARQASGGKTFTVQILDPHIPPSNFDLLVVPEHDALTGPNIIRTIGSPAYFSPEALEEAAQAFADLADETRRSAIVILGGDSRVHTFTQAAADRLEGQMRGLAADGWRLRLTASRRTPVPIAARFRQMAGDIGAAFWAGPQDGPNPYLAWLLFSNAAIVTEDSANMLSEAAWHGLPVHIARLEGHGDKFDRLHDSLLQRGVARWFTGTLDQWSYEPLREAERVADLIVEKLLERYPPPTFTGSVKAPDWLS